MINERVEVMRYLKGQNLYRDNEYRICLLMAKWFYEQGHTTVLEIREQLKQWATANNFYLKVSMNAVAQHVIEDKMKLLGDQPLYINEEDVNLIVQRFDTYYERIVALGALCYAKIYADAKGEFKLSLSGFSHWLNVNPRTATKYLARLEALEYVQRVSESETKSWYNTTVASQLYRYRILVPVVNAGEYQLIDNNIEALYAQIFMQQDVQSEEWSDIAGYNNCYQISNKLRVRALPRSINGRWFPGRILHQFQSKTSDIWYVNMRDTDGTQKKVAVQKLLELSEAAL